MGVEEIVELEAVVSDHDYDNYKDVLETCNDLLDAATQPALRARVVHVLATVIDEIEGLGDPTIAEYLGDWGTRAFWEKIVDAPLV